MIVAKFSGSRATIARGLIQWDYGQELIIENSEFQLEDNTEVGFYQGPLSHTAYLKNRHVLIPDIMLQNSSEIIAYVYVRGKDCGQTILSIRLPVMTRPRPENYVLPEYKEYMRLLPTGGEQGQALAKRSNEDFDVAWIDASESTMQEMSDDEVDAIFKL